MGTKKRGRPALEDPRDKHVKVRLDSKEEAMVDKLHKVTGESRAEVTRRALRYYADFILGKDN